MENNTEVKKAILPIAGLGTRFLPLSLAVPKEFFPLVDKPMVQYAIEEMKASGISEIVFVVSPRQKMVVDYLRNHNEMEKMLEKRRKEKLLKELRDFHELLHGMKISFVTQKEMLGNANAVAAGKKFVKNEPFAVSFSDDVFHANDPATLQLITIFKTCNAPVLGLRQLPKEEIPAYGSVAVEKIANNLYKIKKIIEKPDPSEIQSNLVSVGRYILTPEIFDYIKQVKPSEKGKEVALADAFKKMLDDGKTVYGYEIKGEWLECGDKLKWLKSFFYMALQDEKYSEDLKDYLKTIK